ncbi:MAG: zf-HC2 domain-containing protein [candidate division Zixibacteria bacterium]|nr:zf-HC2 domain-containing protein [candidate division Zixibacteria bacterium]MDH3937414.1 zf-HC2 domain-containing protein [candidate division Zixibacteria bacterium]MDH4035231.1 zf-HC2 domain-containing protein [candidate division Zixibacteria bacterium]
MSTCTDHNKGALLHAFELGLLDDTERERFEMHLLECEHCHTLVDSFESEAAILSNSNRVKAAVDQSLSTGETGESLWQIIWRHLWPSTPFMLRPLVAYLLVLVLLIPAYRGFRSTDQASVSEYGQSLHLSPIRSVMTSLSKQNGRHALLTFEFDSYRLGIDYRVVIESEDGLIVYANPEFDNFDQREVASLDLDLTRLEPGRYRLSIFEAQTERAEAKQVYLFKITE